MCFKQTLLALFLAFSSVQFLSHGADVAFAQRDIDNLSPTFFVSEDGSDAWSGRFDAPKADGSDGPFATFARARDAVRENKKALGDKPIVIEVLAGLYEFDSPLTLNSDDSGTETNAPIVWRARRGDRVQLSAGRFLKGVSKSTDSDQLSCLSPEVRDKIVEADLSNLGIDDFGSPANGVELFFQGAPTRIARYPNDGFVKITGLPSVGVSEVDIRGVKGIKEGRFYFDDEELRKCSNESDLWVDGYWFWDWSQQKHRVENIDVVNNLMTLAEPYHSYGYRLNQWFYVFNALCELDAPGEFYIDRDNKRLFFYPPADEWNEEDYLLTNAASILRLENVSHIVWSGFEMFGCRETTLLGVGYLNDVTIQRCDICNGGGSGIYLPGSNLVVAECELWNLGRGGINVSGGDRNTLTPSNNRVVDNYVHDYARIQRVYETGVSINGVGNYAGHNLIENAPHMGMGFGGNDNVIEYNEIDNVCFESNDAGAIYTGRNWTMRGNAVRYNFLHDISGFRNNGCVGVYLDDMFSSADIIGNLFVNVTRAAFIGGGRDCKIIGNLFVDCHPSLHIDARGAGWANDHIQQWLKEFEEKGTISGIKIKESPYAERYPELASMLDSDKKPEYPEGCVVSDNVCIGGTWDVNKRGQWQGSSVEEAARPFLKMDRNLVYSDDDGSFFEAREKGDYRFKKDSAPVREGFNNPPVLEMGLKSEHMREKARRRRALTIEK